jgi:hypothetical protein
MIRRKYVTQSATPRRSKPPSAAAATSQPKPKTAKKKLTNEQLELLKRLKQLNKQIDEQHDRARWLGRPRIHTAIFEDVAEDEELANLVAKFGGKLVGSQVSERARELNDLMNTLGLSGERCALFKQLVRAYRREPTIERYIQIRRKFPEVEIQISRFGGIDALFELQEDFEKQGIEPELVAGALDSDEPSLDALSLHLLECLVARSKLPRDGAGYIDKRRSAISDAMVNYLISIMLEALDWHEETFRVPASLIVLIWHQLCAGTLEVHQTFLSKERREAAAFRAAQWFESGEKISVRKLASVTGIPRSTAARWLADEKFKKSLQAFQQWDIIQKARETNRRPSQ